MPNPTPEHEAKAREICRQFVDVINYGLAHRMVALALAKAEERGRREGWIDATHAARNLCWAESTRIVESDLEAQRFAEVSQLQSIGAAIARMPLPEPPR